MSKKNKNVFAIVLVNFITSLRIFGSFILIPVYIRYDGIVSGLTALAFLGTDCIDGFLARHLKAQTFFGCILDAISDKVFGIVCLALLSSFNPIFLSILFLEILITVVNNLSLSKGNNVQSSFLGKVKTILLSMTIIISFLIIEPSKLLDLLNISSGFIYNILQNDSKDLTTSMALLVLGADLFVFSDYIHRARMQSIEFEKNENITISDIENSINDLENKKNELKVNSRIKKRKSKEELLDNLFDTEYYINHKNDSIRYLIFK